MAKDIGDVLPQPEMLQGEQVADKDAFLKQRITITDFVLLPSSFEGSTEYAVMQFTHKGKQYTMSVGQVITKKLVAVGKTSLPIDAVFAKTKNRKGSRSYYDLVSGRGS